MDGLQRQELQAGTNWETVTFAGTGTDDARLFVAKLVGTTDIEIAEIDAAGQTVNSANLSTIIGGAVGPNVSVGSLRYSSFHNSLFIGVNTDTLAGAVQIILGTARSMGIEVEEVAHGA